MEEFGALDSSEKTTAVLGDTGRWWRQAAKQEGHRKITKKFLCSTWKQMLEVSLLGLLRGTIVNRTCCTHKHLSI